MTKPTVWTHFWDMHSGGGKKESFEHCFIEANKAKAVAIFTSRFGHSPNRISCDCCGEDYSTEEGETLIELTGYHHGCARVTVSAKGVELTKIKLFDRPIRAKRGHKHTYADRKGDKDYIPLATFLQSDDVEVIYKKDIGGVVDVKNPCDWHNLK